MHAGHRAYKKVIKGTAPVIHVNKYMYLCRKDKEYGKKKRNKK